VITTCIITWPDSTTVTARMSSRDSGQSTEIQWTGAVNKLSAPPNQTDSLLLELYMEDQADNTGGVLLTDRGGNLWPAMDEVKP
jgi:hypothetical protein